ncbi:MAG: hypothetical protein RJA22_415 [Verrucomicrobiota bacterium]|jgi:uncharacterized membrane protein (DUF4010 family)
MDLPDIIQQLGIALGLGLLVGLQRERTDSRLAGFRTFPIITLLGALCALLARDYGGWILGGGLAGLTLVIVVGNRPPAKAGEPPPGVTTETTMLVMFAVGACLMHGLTAVAVTVTGVVAVLLHLKPEMHALAARLGRDDFKAIMQFVLVSLVILPVLPNRPFGPYLVLNPFKIWLMVVLIVGISLAGYILYKFASPRAGAWAGGVLGGLVSSTATTVSYSRRSRATPEATGLAAFVVLGASAIVFPRVLLLISATAPGFLSTAAGPMAVMFVILAVTAWWQWTRDQASNSPPAEPGNPSELRTAIGFATLYSLVLLGIAAARDLFGNQGLYVMSVLSGLTDMDAITLSITQMVHAGTLPPETAWRCILTGAMSNLAFKAGLVALLGHHTLRPRVLTSFALTCAAGGLLLWLWP